MTDKVFAWHHNTLAGHVDKRDGHSALGYRFLSLSLHGTVDHPRYTAVMIQRSKVVAQRDFPLLTNDEFVQTFKAQSEQGFGPVLISAIGTATNPRFAVVFERMDHTPLTRHRLHLGTADDPDSLQGMNKLAHDQHLILRSLSAYGDGDQARFAAVWVPNTGHVVWNADGVLESANQYQTRFDVQKSAWCRPALVTLQGSSKRYCSVFVHNELGRMVARHGLTHDGYQAAFDQHVKTEGLVPVCVQAGGVGEATRWAALFAASDQPLPENFHADGPRANAVIDGMMEKIMRASPLWHAGLAIVHKKKLVFARGYSYGEPSWPQAKPTTHFRVASVSKLLTAVAIYRAMQRLGPSQLSLDTRVQDILQLKTPSGKPPKDPRFKAITLRQLLDHTSGLSANAHRDELAIRNAFQATMPVPGSVHLPVTEAMCDAYIASLDLAAAPGTMKGYNNCGYTLLGRVLAKLHGQARVIDALQLELLTPLGMSRTRQAHARLADNPADEARYRSSGDDGKPDIPVVKSVMSDDQPLVPLGYGDLHLDRMTGGGGLSVAPVDLARLLATLVAGGDTPSLKWDTVQQMFSNGLAAQADWSGKTNDNRSGHGWDAMSQQAGGGHFAQKGGSLDTSGSKVIVNGEWGLVYLVAGKPDKTTVLAQFGDGNLAKVLAEAKLHLANGSDLFPQFGMPPL